MVRGCSIAHVRNAQLGVPCEKAIYRGLQLPDSALHPSFRNSSPIHRNGELINNAAQAASAAAFDTIRGLPNTTRLSRTPLVARERERCFDVTCVVGCHRVIYVSCHRGRAVKLRHESNQTEPDLFTANDLLSRHHQI